MPPPREHCGNKGLIDFCFVDAVNQLYQHKNAFTLAEVLITLGIIGIVAALTMPNLIANYQKNILRNQLKKSLSVYNQALIQTVEDMGGDTGCFYSQTEPRYTEKSTCAGFMKQFTKNLKVVKTCKGNSLADGCVPKYHSYPTVVGCSGFSENAINNQNTTYVLADGNIIISYSSYDIHPLFAFDINGLKGPNKSGYDLFAIQIDRATNSQAYIFNPAIQSCFGAEPGGLGDLTDVMGK